MYFSDFFGIQISGHNDVEFVDINLNTDTKLFLDPTLIELLNTPFAKCCTATINSFFEKAFTYCKTNNDAALLKLLDFGHEPNETKLGLSRKQSIGKGSSAEILFGIFKQISRKKLLSTGLVEEPRDICLFVENFAEDRMSDLLTNILRKELYTFSKQQCQKYGILPSSKKETIGCYWNPTTQSWDSLVDHPIKANNSNLILIPKAFVRPKYVYSVDSYLRHRILIERQNDHLQKKTGLTKVRVDKSGNQYHEKPSKKAIYEKEVKGTRHKEYVEKYSRQNPHSLSVFRDQMRQKTLLTKWLLSDEQLDLIVYKKSLKAS